MAELAARLRPLAGLGAPAVTVVRSGGLGDTILLLPALAWLRHRLSAARLTLVGSSWATALSPLIPLPLTVLPFDAPAYAPLFTDAPAPVPPPLAAADAVVIYTADPQSAFVANVAAGRRAAPVVWPAHPPPGRYAAAHFADALADSPLSDDELPLAALQVSAEAARWAQAWLAGRLPSGMRPIAVHPGSGGRRKCWPADRFAALVTAAARPVLLLEGPADAAQAACLVRALPVGVPWARVREPSLARVAALLLACDGYVGSDSGLTHLAAALGCRVAAVFGTTDPAVWAPRGPRVAVVPPPASDTWPQVAEVLAALTRLLQPTT